MAEPEMVSIEKKKLFELKERLLAGQNPRVVFRGTELEDIKTMEEEAGFEMKSSILYALSFVKQYVP